MECETDAGGAGSAVDAAATLRTHIHAAVYTQAPSDAPLTHVAIKLTALASTGEGVPATPTDLMAAATARPPVFVAVIDNSGSMERHKALLAACVAEMARALPAGSTLGVLAFADGVDTLLPLTVLADAAAVEAAVATATAGITVDGNSTNLDGAVQGALDMVFRRTGAAATAMVHVVLLTDGQATSGARVQTRDIVNAAKAHPATTNVLLHCIGFGGGAPCDLLCALSRACHGGFHAVATPEDVGAAFGDCVGSALTAVASHVTVEVTPLMPEHVASAQAATYDSDVSHRPVGTWPADFVLHHDEPRTLVTAVPSRTAALSISMRFTTPDGAAATASSCVTLHPRAADGAYVAAHLLRERAVVALDALDAAETALAQHAPEPFPVAAAFPHVAGGGGGGGGGAMPPTGGALMRTHSMAGGRPFLRVGGGGIAHMATLTAAAAWGGTGGEEGEEEEEEEETTGLSRTLSVRPTPLGAAQAVVAAAREHARAIAEEAKKAEEEGGDNPMAGLYAELHARLADVLARRAPLHALVHQAATQRAGVSTSLGPPPPGPALGHTLSTVSGAAAVFRTITGAAVARAVSGRT